jgi:DNA-binding NtrC family response regulator
VSERRREPKPGAAAAVTEAQHTATTRTPRRGWAVLVVQPEGEIRAGLVDALERRGYVVHPAATGRSALAIARRQRLHALILDLDLPDMGGLAALDAILDQVPALPSLVVTGSASVDTAVEAMKRGAMDFLTKPIPMDSLLSTLEGALRRADASGAAVSPQSEAMMAMQKLGIIGRSQPMLQLFEMIKRLAPHYSTVLVTGESGTGKELVARALHSLGPRALGPFVALNCATLEGPILESELFGHEKGAFTSADRQKPGVMETAHGGTLFLDEVNEMGPACQAKLLRAIERREFRRVGGTRKIRVDLAVIAASNVDLEAWVRENRFRADLYYRLKVVSLVVPALRDRRDVVPLLARHFLDEHATRLGLPAKRLTAEAQAQLIRYDWPGNVRELRNAMESVTLMAPSPGIGVDDLPPELRRTAAHDVRFPIGTSLESAERELILRTVDSAATLKDAARTLGIGLRTLHTKLRRYGPRRVPS